MSFDNRWNKAKRLYSESDYPNAQPWYEWLPKGSPSWQDDSRPGRKLIDYLEPKIHHMLKKGDWKRVIVVGNYERGGKSIASESERRFRGFNWQRPTAEVIDEDTIQLNCFPSENYVGHYACLVSTYFKLLNSEHILGAMHGHTLRRGIKIDVTERHTSLSKPYAIFSESNLSEIGMADVVILGYLDTCPSHVIESNPRYREIKICQEGQMFSWYKQQTSYGLTVAYLGCAVTLWGQCVDDLAVKLVEYCKVKCILYIGKAGSLDDTVPSNECIATGNVCDVDGVRKEHFPNVLLDKAPASDIVRHGNLTTVPSPLCEDDTWFRRWRRNYSWVECETAYFARAAYKLEVDFGYLHVVSDNLGRQYSENLANEDDDIVQHKRVALFKAVDRILEEFLEGYGKGVPGVRTANVTQG